MDVAMTIRTLNSIFRDEKQPDRTIEIQSGLFPVPLLTRLHHCSGGSKA